MLNYAQLAAGREADTGAWQARFESLIQQGLLSAGHLPGQETAMHIRHIPSGQTSENTVSFCSERLTEAWRGNYSLGIDLSHVEPKQGKNWSQHLQSSLSVFSGRVTDSCSGSCLFFSVAEDCPVLEAVVQLTRSRSLGYPVVAVRYTGETSVDAAAKKRWHMLVERSHADCRLKLVPRQSLRPLSGLQSLEKGDSVMPLSLFEVGTDTAWLMLEIDAYQLFRALRPRKVLSTCLRFADNLIDAIRWPLPALQVDALLNRRVGFHVVRIGDMLRRQAFDPAKIDTFRWLRRWLNFIQRCLKHESMLLARRRGPFPELGSAELIAELAPCYGEHNARRLIKNHSLRHRHILALSPFALFPQEPCAYADSNWLNLIPALDCADALTMYGPDPRYRLNIDGWNRLLRLTGALGKGKSMVTESGLAKG